MSSLVTSATNYVAAAANATLLARDTVGSTILNTTGQYVPYVSQAVTSVASVINESDFVNDLSTIALGISGLKLGQCIAQKKGKEAAGYAFAALILADNNVQLGIATLSALTAIALTIKANRSQVVSKEKYELNQSKKSQ